MNCITDVIRLRVELHNSYYVHVHITYIVMAGGIAPLILELVTREIKYI